MHLVDVVAGGLVGRPVDSDAVPDLILDNQHPDFLQLLAQLFDVIADDAVMNIDVGPMIEHIQRTRYIDFQRRGDVLGLLLVLRPQQVVQILQNRHIFRARVVEIILVDQPHTAVDDGFLHRLQTIFTAHDQLAQ